MRKGQIYSILKGGSRETIIAKSASNSKTIPRDYVNNQ